MPCMKYKILNHYDGDDDDDGDEKEWKQEEEEEPNEHKKWKEIESNESRAKQNKNKKEMFIRIASLVALHYETERYINQTINFAWQQRWEKECYLSAKRWITIYEIWRWLLCSSSIHESRMQFPSIYIKAIDDGNFTNWFNVKFSNKKNQSKSLEPHLRQESEKIL